MNHSHVPAPELFQSKRINRLLLVLLGIGALFLGIVLITGLVAPAGSDLRRQFAFSWLFAFIYFFTILIGCLFWILVHHATDSGWGIVVRRQMENLAALLPWMILFFIPLVVFRFDIWNWLTAKDHLEANPALGEKIGYFELHFGAVTLPFFWIRAVLYFLYFAGAAIYFRRVSVRQDSDGDPRWSIQMRGFSFVGIILFALGTTFMAFDWLASLDYRWASTMWGVYIFAGSAGAAMALIILVVLTLKNAGYLSFVNAEHYHMMGKLLFCFSIFWGYIGFSQYMLIWYGNIPEETSWFLRRNIGSWNTLSIALVVGRFFIPFLYLLFQYTKRTPRFLAFMSLWVLAMHLLDIFVTINPFIHPTGVQVSWLDLATLFAIGFPLAFLFLRSLGATSLFPARDPRLLESVNVSN
ncbi:MAG TPA: hypothetical protein VHS80_04810 [Chthoniobacterales bacterium]|jgi:hypothetical protein|nr:hypothetical protein [Chthoniobacterales bacterium]